MDIENLLQQYGFNKNEIAVYLILLKKGRLAPSEISKLTKINRSTTYNAAKELASKGVVIEDLSGKTLSLIPSDINNLKNIIEREKSELKEKELLADKIVEKLSLITAEKSYPVPRMRFVQEESLTDFLFTQTEIWNKSALKLDGIWWGFQDHTLVEKYAGWIDWFWKHAPKGIKVKLISNESEIEHKLKGQYKNREIKFTKDTNFSATTWVIGNYVVMINTQHSPDYLVEIHDVAFAHNSREVFKQLRKSC